MVIEMIFYFTGTGNSLYVAKELDEDIISIPQVIKEEKPEFTADRIGIVCPVYGHEMPAMVKDFIRRASFKTDYLFVVLTYGAHVHVCPKMAVQFTLSRPEKNPAARYRNEHVTLCELVKANDQTTNENNPDI